MPTVELTPQAQQEALDLPKLIRARLYRAIERLADWPDVSGAKPLRGALAGRYRLRTGDYRIQFYAKGDVVTVEKIGHRDRFYE
ncbi:MAG: type II toxin-antitoxin system RelE/ParE family toxin [Pirellulales bacterium]